MVALSLGELRSAPARSWLFVPATQPQRFAKAAASGADRIIIDLEDAVATEVKVEARQLAASQPLPNNVPVYLRINSVGTEWFEADLALAATLPLTGVMLPKAERAELVAAIVAVLPAAQVVVPLIETAAGLWNVLELAQGSRVERLAFGAIDFQGDTGMLCSPEEEAELAYARSRIVIASRVAYIASPVDSPSLSIDDVARLERDAQRSRRFGFAGKLCIHPKQVISVHAAFRPSEAEVEWARSLFAALAQRPQDQRGAISYRGAMVDKPVIARAKAILNSSVAELDS